MYTETLLMILAFWAGCAASFAGGDDDKPKRPRHAVEEPEPRKWAPYDNGMEEESLMKEEAQEMNLIPNANIMEEEPEIPNTSFTNALEDILRSVQEDVKPGEGNIQNEKPITTIVLYDYKENGPGSFHDVSKKTSYAFYDGNNLPSFPIRQWQARQRADSSVITEHDRGLMYHIITHEYWKNPQIQKINANTFCNLQEIYFVHLHQRSPSFDLRDIKLLTKFEGNMKKIDLGWADSMRYKGQQMSPEAQQHLSKMYVKEKLIFVVSSSFGGRWPCPLPSLTRGFRYVIKDLPLKGRSPLIFQSAFFAEQMSANNAPE